MPPRIFARPKAGALVQTANVEIAVPARRQIDAEIAVIGGQIIRVFTPAIPNSAQNTVGAGRMAFNAICRHDAPIRIERVNGVCGVKAVIRPIQHLDRSNIQHHRRLGPAPKFVGVVLA